MAPSMLNRSSMSRPFNRHNVPVHLPKPEEDPGGGPLLKAQMEPSGARANASLMRPTPWHWQGGGMRWT